MEVLKQFLFKNGLISTPIFGIKVEAACSPQLSEIIV